MKKDGLRSVLASLISIMIGLLAGGLIILIVGLTSPELGLKSAWEGIQLIFLGLFSKARDAQGALQFGFNPNLLGNMLFRAMPLILTGLSVAVANKTGLFNIGAPGQYLAGIAASLYIALSLPVEGSQLTAFFLSKGLTFQVMFPSWLVWVLAFLGGMAAGAIWGAIPGLLKSLLNINEVLACIMTNWIAAGMVTWVFDIAKITDIATGKDIPKFKNMIEGTKTSVLYKTSVNGVETPKMGLDQLFPNSQVNGSIFIAIFLAVVMFVLFKYTTFGFELRTCGSNRYAARYAGIRDKRNIVISMAIAGAMAGAAGALYSLSGNTEFHWETYQSLPAVGFNGIPVALLASNHPLGVIITGMFMSMLDICGQRLSALTAYNEYITDVVIAVIVYLSSFTLLIKMVLSKFGREKKRPGKEQVK